MVQDLATNIGDGEVELKSGGRVKFEYLAIATGTRQNPPAQVRSIEKEDGCMELKDMQGKIKEAKNIAIVGGGPVGVQLAGDIKTFYEDKRVVLIHSRNQLLPNFGKRLHEFVVSKLVEAGVTIVLDERPLLPKETGVVSLQFKDGRSEQFDLVVCHPNLPRCRTDINLLSQIPCTGQIPNSSILNRFRPDVISLKNGGILVRPTLQILVDDHLTSKTSQIFALGDVAETGGPKMGRAGMMQAEIVRANIVSLIHGKTELESYKPIPLEGGLKLSLGKVRALHSQSHGFRALLTIV